jgi:hypothetical protein
MTTELDLVLLCPTTLIARQLPALFPLVHLSRIPMSVVCARQGCGSTFAPEANAEASCSFHPGAPVRRATGYPPSSPARRHVAVANALLMPCLA